VRQRAPPAVDVLAGNSQAAQNVAEESPRHAPQLVAVPPPESADEPASLGMEKAPQNDLPEKLPIGVSRPLLAPFVGDCSSFAEMQRPPVPLCPVLATDTEIDSTVQELQYGSQTHKEKSPSNSETNQIQPFKEGAGLITGTKEKRSITLEYKPETGTNMELGGNILLQPRSQIRFTAPSPSVPQSSVGFGARDATEHTAPGPSDGDPPVQVSPPGTTVRAGGHPDSKPTPLPLPSSGSSEIKQTDLPKTQHKIIKGSSTDAREIQTANSLESVETFEHVKELVDGQPPSTEILETGKAGEPLSGLHASPEKDGGDQLGGERSEGSVREGHADVSLFDFTSLPECSTSQESSSKASASPLPFDTDDGERVVEAETSHHEAETTPLPPPAELVHSAEAQEMVVVREETHISGDWTNMHLNQSYLLQREDGSVCELSADLSAGEPKLYEESVQMEVYEFCTLVEEVAEETVCASSSGAQMPHSPGYEMNLFNALLEHSEEYTVKEDLESGAVIISQQPLHLCSDANGNSHNLSVQTTRAAAVGQHLIFEARPSEDCLVEVAAVALEQTDGGPQMVTPQVGDAPSDQMETCDSPGVQTVPAKQEAGVTAGALSFTSPAVAGEDAGTDSSVAILLRVQPALNQTVVSATKCEAPVSSHKGTNVAPALTETPSQSMQNAAVPTETKPAALCATRSPGLMHPKLLFFKPGETPILKAPPSLSALVSKPQNASGELAHSAWSGTVSEECLPQSVSDPLCASDQSQCSVDKSSVSAAPGVSLPLDPAASVSPTSCTSKSDNDALTVAQTSREADVVASAGATTAGGLYALPSSAGVDDLIGPTESLYEEGESEDMEQDEATGETEAQEASSGQISSPDEGSDEEPDADKTESEMTHSSPLKVVDFVKQVLFCWV